MRVGIVAFSDLDYALDVANALSERQLSVSLYLSRARLAGAVGSSTCPEDSVRRQELIDPSTQLRLYHLPRLRDPMSFAAVRSLAKAMRADGVELAHILMGPGEVWLGVLATLLRGMPVASTMIIPKPNVGERLPAMAVWAPYKLLASGSDVIIVNGACQVHQVRTLYGLAPHRIVHVPLGGRTTASRWSRRAQAEEPGTVLFFGPARHHKGLEYLVRAAPIITARVQGARILIASHGADLNGCLQLIHDRTKFEIHDGFVPGDRVAAYFERASVVVLPYLSASTSGILMTAYSLRRPVVATSVGCLPEYVVDGVTGLLVPPADVDQLAAAVVRLLSDEALRHRMAQAAADWLRDHQERVLAATLRAYDLAVALHRNAASLPSGPSPCVAA